MCPDLSKPQGNIIDILSGTSGPGLRSTSWPPRRTARSNTRPPPCTTRSCPWNTTLWGIPSPPSRSPGRSASGCSAPAPLWICGQVEVSLIVQNFISQKFCLFSSLFCSDWLKLASTEGSKMLSKACEQTLETPWKEKGKVWFLLKVFL